MAPFYINSLLQILRFTRYHSTKAFYLELDLSVPDLYAKLHMQGLSLNTTDDTLSQAFSAYGQVVDETVVKDEDTGSSKGFGYVTFSSPSEAEAAVAELHERELDGGILKIRFVEDDAM